MYESGFSSKARLEGFKKFTSVLSYISVFSNYLKLRAVVIADLYSQPTDKLDWIKWQSTLL